MELDSLELWVVCSNILSLCRWIRRIGSCSGMILVRRKWKLMNRLRTLLMRLLSNYGVSKKLEQHLIQWRRNCKRGNWSHQSKPRRNRFTTFSVSVENRRVSYQMDRRMRRIRSRVEARRGIALINRKHIHYSITKGPQFALEVKQLETDLTVEMLASYVFYSRFLSSSHPSSLDTTGSRSPLSA